MGYVAQQGIRIVGTLSYYNIVASRWLGYGLKISGQEVEIIHFVEFLCNINLFMWVMLVFCILS